MIHQTDMDFEGHPIQKYGCFYLSTLWHVSTRLPISLDTSAIKILLALWDLSARTFNEKPPVSSDCYVNSYDRVAKWFGIIPIRPAAKARIEYLCAPDECELLVFEYKGSTHCTAGNGSGIVTYDPIPYSPFVIHGRLIGKRILSWRREDQYVI